MVPTRRCPRPACLDGRTDGAVFLATEQSVLAGMRIETGDGDPRWSMPNRGNSHAVNRIVVSIDAWPSVLAALRQRDVHRRQDDAQCFGVKHHRHGGNTRQVGEQIGMAVPWKAGQPERLLVDRRRRDRGDTVLPRLFHRTNDGFIRRTAGVGAQQPGLNDRPLEGP